VFACIDYERNNGRLLSSDKVPDMHAPDVTSLRIISAEFLRSNPSITNLRCSILLGRLGLNESHARIRRQLIATLQQGPEARCYALLVVQIVLRSRGDICMAQQPRGCIDPAFCRNSAGKFLPHGYAEACS